MNSRVESNNSRESTGVSVDAKINAPVNKVFRLACPVEEYKWIPGWKCELVHCPNDRNEKGVVFNEIMSAPFLMAGIAGRTTWTTLVYNSETLKIHFRLENKISSSIYKIELSDIGDSKTAVHLDFTYAALNRKGAKMIEKNVEEKIRKMLSLLTLMLTYYSENEKMINAVRLQGIVLKENGLSPADKLHLALNKLHMKLMRDKDRSRFMAKFAVQQ